MQDVCRRAPRETVTAEAFSDLDGVSREGGKNNDGITEKKSICPVMTGVNAKRENLSGSL